MYVYIYIYSMRFRYSALKYNLKLCLSIKVDNEKTITKPGSIL